MIAVDESALICDLAETYHVYDYRSLPVQLVATFCVGLRENSRIKMKLSGMSYPYETILLAGIIDKLSLLVWQRTKDGVSGENVPKSVLATILNIENVSEKDHLVYDSAEDFERAKDNILRSIDNGK